ncbi:MAG TPA: enoyl-CoA hydratase/isomerase family protein [Pseudonocardiaceae bacterium]|jgi:thioesterase DpgC|nr:enoyl-CoA hydratase/isomerase family protein [Pseudonocardiaceae bacterium]
MTMFDSPDSMPLTGNYQKDRAAVRERLAALERWSADDPRSVAVIAGRDLVAGFLERHANRFYAELTDGMTVRLTCAQLLARVAKTCPEFLPGKELLAEDDLRPMRSRRRLEQDQAVVLRGILRDREAGNHILDTMRLPDPANLARAKDFDLTGQLDLASVRVERIGEAGHVTLLNVDTLNAEDNKLVADLNVAVDVVMLAETVRVGVLRGGRMRHPKYAGRRVFCAGINLKDLGAGRISYLDFLIGREAGFLSKMTRGLFHMGRANSHTPWIAVIDAFAIGGGLQLALAADYVIAEADSFASLPAAQEGIVPGVANLRLPRRVGLALARDMILHGRVVRAKDPDAAPLYDEVVDAAEMAVTVKRVVARLGVPAVRANKQMLALGVEPQDDFRTYLAEFVSVQAERMYGDDVLAKVEARTA